MTGARFVIPAEPVMASRPLADRSPGRSHGAALQSQRDRPDRATVGHCCRCGRIKAKSFAFDGEAVVLGPDGMSRVEELRSREAVRTAILYAFDLIEHDGEDPRDRPFLDRKAALA